MFSLQTGSFRIHFKKSYFRRDRGQSHKKGRTQSLMWQNMREFTSYKKKRQPFSHIILCTPSLPILFNRWRKMPPLYFSSECFKSSLFCTFYPGVDFPCISGGKWPRKKREIQRLVDSKHYKAATDRPSFSFLGIGTCPEYHTLYTLKIWFQQYISKSRKNKFNTNFSKFFLNAWRSEQSVHFHIMLC